MLPFLWGKTFHFRGRRHRGEDHRPRHWRRRRWGRGLRLLRSHRGRLHLARGDQNSRLWLLLRVRGLLIHPLLHHHTRMPTELGHRYQSLKAGSAIRDQDHHAQALKPNLTARAIGIGSRTLEQGRVLELLQNPNLERQRETGRGGGDGASRGIKPKKPNLRWQQKDYEKLDSRRR
uniref:Uncharacterized protein n=1 Tax=Arundo donax TaxID=35708 RepID=A0A0A9CUX4_ARUDO